MVATSGVWGRLAPSLVAMVNEADDLAPSRSTGSDGSIGDPAHAARLSYHNPENGFVDALDLTHDPMHGFDVHARARDLIRRGDDRLDHVISDNEIWSAAQPRWRPYTGPNSHTQHAHFAVKRTAAGRTASHIWWPQPTDPPKPPLPPEENDEMASVLIKKATDPKWWLSDGFQRRHIISRSEAGVMAFVGIAKWNDGEAFVVPDDVIDRLPIAP